MSNRIQAARAAKAQLKSLQSLRNVLCALNGRHPGHMFYWVDGTVRERWLRPTKGWTSRRWERVAVPGLSGTWDVVSLKEAIARAKAAA